jgi:hypothetical protein
MNIKNHELDCNAHINTIEDMNSQTVKLVITIQQHFYLAHHQQLAASLF